MIGTHREKRIKNMHAVRVRAIANEELDLLYYCMPIIVL